MAKPFSIQSPEDIAKEYGGNKQKIAQAMQMGIVDATAGVLAGMFIDRMRSAQVQEGINPPTVAQQVMGGIPTPPAAPTPGASLPAGLGAIPQAAPPMTPDMSAMAAMPEAPVGMAEGGIVGLDVPEGMFDEPSNGGFDDGYAGGGLVAFANGGGIDVERLRAALRAQESGGDYGITNFEGSGAMGAYQFMPDTARALAKRLGIEYRPDLMQGALGRSKGGIEYQERLMDEQMKDILAFSGDDVGRAGTYHFAGPNEKGHGPKTRQYASDIIRRYSGSKDTGDIPERDLSTAEGRSQSIEDIFGDLQSRFGPSEEAKALRARRMARAEEMASDEYYEEQRKASMWETLAEIGFNMASSQSPFLLQAIGEAAAASMPGARASKRERQQLKDRALDVMQAMNDKSRKENLELYGIAVDEAKTGLSQKQFEQKMALDERQVKLAEDKLAAEIDAAEKAGADPEKVAASYVLNYAEGTPQYEAAKRYYNLRFGARDGRSSNADETAKRVREGGGGTQEGARATDTEGKPIVYSGGQWVYEE